MPAPIQNLALTAAATRTRRVRFGPGFDERLSFLRSSAGWDRTRIREYQDERVAALVGRAYAETDYYRRVMDERGLTPDDIRGVADIDLLPILTKDDIRENFAALQSARVRGRSFIEVQTSGSTGAPLRLRTTRDALTFKWAVWWRHRSWFGIERGNTHINFNTKPLVSLTRSRPPYWLWNRLESQALLPLQQVVPAKVDAITGFLDRTPFEFYSGYPSIIHSLAVLSLDRGLRVSRGPRIIFTGAEGVLDQQREDIAAYCGSQIAEMYGFNEGAGNASGCPAGNLHEDFEFGYLEAGDPVQDQQTGVTTGRMIATGFSTHGFPLIRYDVGDTGRWKPRDFECPCGRRSRVLDAVEGRWEDYIVTPDGHQARRLGEIFKQMPNLKQFQMVQDTPDALTLRLVARDSYTRKDEDELSSRVAKWISPSLLVSFSYVDEIAPGPNGKYQRIVSNVQETAGGRPAGDSESPDQP